MGAQDTLGINDKGITFEIVDGPSAMEVMFNLFHPETRMQQWLVFIMKDGSRFRAEIDEFAHEPLRDPMLGGGYRRPQNRVLDQCRLKGTIMNYNNSSNRRSFSAKYSLHDRKGSMRVHAVKATIAR